jgi:formylglycine-generating enzyme required for sulfatase activity
MGGSYRVYRGGNWGSVTAQRCRSGHEWGSSPSVRATSLGFRVLRSSVK